MEEQKIVVTVNSLDERTKESLNEWLLDQDQVREFTFRGNSIVAIPRDKDGLSVLVEQVRFPLIIRGIPSRIEFEGVKGLIKPVEFLSHHADIVQEVKHENDNFSFTDFLRGNFGEGVILVTKDDSAFAYCINLHEFTTASLYTYFYENPSIIKKRTTPTWQEAVIDNGDAAIQIYDYRDFIFWLPPELNSYQYHTLLDKIEELQEEERKHGYGIRCGVTTLAPQDSRTYYAVADYYEAKEEIPVEYFDYTFRKYCEDNNIYSPKVKVRN